MISVIIAKYHPTQIDILRKNIEETIGVPHELIVIENGKGEMGLCEVYNKGARMAKYDLLCYSHEDVRIITAGWGNTIVELFNRNEKLGLLGLAGAGFKSNSPSGWWYEGADPRTMFSNFIQGNKTDDEGIVHFSNPLNTSLAPVVCVDGFWFCTRRQCALELKFDETTFKGFHCYDIDFSLSVFQHYDVAVTFKILISHFSDGTGSVRDWIKDTLTLYKKWQNILPFDVIPLSAENKQKEEIKALNYFLGEMLRHDFSQRQVYCQLWTRKAISRLGIAGFLRVNFDTGSTGVRRFYETVIGRRKSAVLKGG